MSKEKQPTPPLESGGASPAACVIQPCPLAQTPDQIAKSINPTNSVINCGNNVDAAISRLYRTNPEAVSPASQDGSFDEIANRNGTTMNWGTSLGDAFDTVRNGGPGTTAIVGIDYGNGSSHVVVMTNDHGTPTIIEGQNWGSATVQEPLLTAPPLKADTTRRMWALESCRPYPHNEWHSLPNA